jgi:L-ascorbate metabolism protein UlaG (beta-lactamase superfamily)
LEEIGMVDIVVVPVGNSGYTLDAVGALKIIKQIEPKVMIPTHFADKDIKYEVPQTELSDALKNLGMESTETLDKYKYKPAELTDAMKLVVLNR